MNDKPVLSIEQLTLPHADSAARIALSAGEARTVLLASDDLGAALLRLLLGLRSPLRGEVALFATPLVGLSVREVMELRCRIGTLVQRGGLLANLKAWENLMLPGEYHRNQPLPTTEEGLAALARVGYGGAPMEPSGRLTLLQRKQVMLARILLCEPELVVCDSLTVGISPADGEVLLDALYSLQQRRPQTALLFLTADPAFAARLPATAVSDFRGGATHAR